jgi:hypothetical protein
MSIESKSPLELVWEYREEVVYPNLFGKTKRGTFVLSSDLFTEVFKQSKIDPRWLHYGVIEFEPTTDRLTWLYVTSGASNPWELEPSEYAKSEFSGFGTEIVLEVNEQSEWAIMVLQRLLAFNILLTHGRYGEADALDYGNRIPLGTSITFDGNSLLTQVILWHPISYAKSFQLDSGQVDFLHAVGITESERDYAKEYGSDQLIERLKDAGAFPITNPLRRAMV